jgi:hypothetical protein
MRRLISFLAVATATVAASVGVAFAESQGDAHQSDTAAENSQAGTNSQAGANSQGQGQGQTQTTQTGQAGGAQSQGTQNSTGEGANQTGPYTSDPNREQAPSLNGRSDNDTSTGKPCAGCVGNADDKNPRGQLPNASSDGNRGYECDDNQGIGKTNPAHSGCQQKQQENPPQNNPPQTTTTPTQAQQPEQGAVLGQQEAGEEAEEVPADEGEEAPEQVEETPAERVLREIADRPRAKELAFTGLGLVWMVLLGAAMTGLGQRMRQRSQSPAEPQLQRPDDPTWAWEHEPVDEDPELVTRR